MCIFQLKMVCPMLESVVSEKSGTGKDADRKTNCADPDQTTPRGAVCSGSALFAKIFLIG